MTRIALKIARVQAGSGEPVAEPEWIDCPPDVTPDTLLSYLTQQFGEPIEVALTATEKNPRLAIGWFFRPTPAVPTGATDNFEAMIIPFIKLEDGSDVAMFLHQAEQLELFKSFAADGRADELTIVDQPQRDYKPQQ